MLALQGGHPSGVFWEAAAIQPAAVQWPAVPLDHRSPDILPPRVMNGSSLLRPERYCEACRAFSTVHAEVFMCGIKTVLFPLVGLD